MGIFFYRFFHFLKVNYKQQVEYCTLQEVAQVSERGWSYHMFTFGPYIMYMSKLKHKR